MNCNCKCNKTIVKINEVNVGEVLYLVAPDMNICNNETLLFVITTNIDYPDEPIPVALIINGEEFYMINHNGNYVYSDQIRNRKLYAVKLATDTLLAKNLKCNLYPTKFDFPCISKVKLKEEVK